MNYKYHHEVLKLLYLKRIEFYNEDNRGKTVASPEILPTNYSAKQLSEELILNDEERARSILTSLREFECLNSRYNSNQKDVFFWITDTGISKYHEQYFKYKRKEQIKQNWATGLKLLFYTISTLGIITSIIYNIYSTRSIIKTINESASDINKFIIPKDSIQSNQLDSITYKTDSLER